MDILSEPEFNYRTGYIRVYRSVKSHWLYEPKRKRTKFEAWLDLLLQAKHSDQKETIGYDLIVIKRGQILTSQEKLAAEWRWDRSAVRSFLSSLHYDQILTIETTNKYTMITICNYDSYQNSSPTNQHQNHQQTNTTSTHTNNDNTLNKLESIPYREFGHLKISVEEFDKLKEMGYSTEQIDCKIDDVKNYKKNKNYTSLYQTVMNWLKKDFPEVAPTNKKEAKKKSDDFEKILELSGVDYRKPVGTR